MMNKKLVTIGLIVLLSFSAAGLELPQVDVLNLRSKAMGGVMLSMADDQYAPVNNPAGMALMKTKYVSILQAQAVISGDFLQAFDQKDDLESLLDGDYNVSNDTWNYISNLRLSVGSTPLYLAILNILPLDLNLVVFNSIKTRVKASPDAVLPTFEVDAFNDTVLMLNWSTKLIDLRIMKIYVGVNAKLIHRVYYSQQNLDIFSMYDFDNKKVEDLDIKRALSFGMDFGAMAQMKLFGRELRLSMTLTDFYGTRFSWTAFDPKDPFNTSFKDSGEQMIEPALNLGAMLRIGTILPLFLENLVVAMDIRNVFDFDIKPMMKAYIGFEFTTLKILKIRGGVYQGWLTGGIGINIPVLPMEINFSYWAEEVGQYPGQQRMDNFGLTLNIVF